MSSMLISEIILEGLLLGGDTSLTARATVALRNWSRSVASGFLWPQLKREGDVIALAAGLQKITVGGGSGGITQEIARINDPLKLYTGTFTAKGDVRVETDWGQGFAVNNIANNPASNIGCPQRCRVKPKSAGGTQDLVTNYVWDIIFDRVADQAYSFEISYYLMPQFATAAERLWYPVDQTCVQAVFAFVLKHKKDWKGYQMATETLKQMVSTDRMSEGVKPGINDTIPLNPKYFR